MMRTDGYLIARWPAPCTRDLGAFYAHPRNGVLVQDVRRHPEARLGVAIGYMNADPRQHPFKRLVVWQRVPGIPWRPT